MLELRPAAQSQYIDAVASFTAHEEAVAEAAQVRGGMYWKNTGYLIRTSASGGEKSLGRRSTDTEAIFERFTLRKNEAVERLAGLKSSLEQHQRLNRALLVGRVDPLVTSLLARLETAKLAEHFRVVGTHALYAYEAAAGIAFDADAVATRDIDLLWDVSRRVRFHTALQRVDTSMLAVLKKVDPSFRVRRTQKYTAVNKDGFEVDILRREPIDQLLDAPAFSAVIVASNGAMARLNTLHPQAFARFKHWMAQLPDRDPRKRQRDELQAMAVEAAVRDYLPQLATDFVAT